MMALISACLSSSLRPASDAGTGSCPIWRTSSAIKASLPCTCGMFSRINLRISLSFILLFLLSDYGLERFSKKAFRCCLALERWDLTVPDGIPVMDSISLTDLSSI